MKNLKWKNLKEVFYGFRHKKATFDVEGPSLALAGVVENDKKSN